MYCTAIKHDGHSRTRSKCAFFSFFHWTVTLLLWEPKTCHPLQKHFKWQCKFAKKNSLRPKFTKAITIKQYLMRWVIGGNKLFSSHERQCWIIQSLRGLAGGWLGGVHFRVLVCGLSFPSFSNFAPHSTWSVFSAGWRDVREATSSLSGFVRLCYKHVSKNSYRGENHRCSETQNS